jgi:aspartyl/asparaginyl beta-hydroxylase (cupin superfamily)
MLRFLKKFDPVRLRESLAVIRPEMVAVHKQVPQGGQLMQGATQYHTGGWKFVPFVEHGHGDFRDHFPYIRDEVLSWFKAPILRARIMILEAGHGINPHRGNLGTPEKVRYLIPITMPEGTTYHVDGEAFRPAPGEVWYLNQNKVHRVENASGEPRHVIACDTRADHPWVRKIFSRAGVEL